MIAFRTSASVALMPLLLVIDQHHDHHGDHARDARIQSRPDRIRAQRRTDRALFQILRRRPAASRRADSAPGRPRLHALPIPVMTPLSLILLSNGRSAQDSSYPARWPAGSRYSPPVKRSKRLAASWVRTKLRFPAPVLTLLRTGVAQIAPGDHRGARQDANIPAARRLAADAPQNLLNSAAARRPCWHAPLRAMRTARRSLHPAPGCAVVFRICLTRAGSSTPGSCTRISASLSGAAAALLHARLGQTQSR